MTAARFEPSGGGAADGAWAGPGQVLAALAGCWRLSRALDNGATMSGTALFAARPDGAFDYREEGRLRLADGHALDAARRYLFAPHEDGFAVLFAEQPPRLMHRVRLRRAGAELAGTAVHLCGEDRYSSRYAFCADGSFVIEHAVRGPRKDYRIRTRYVRAAISA